MLESITLKFTESEPLKIEAPGVTIFVGPNNSGKSLVLRELEQDISSQMTVATKILEDYDIVWSTSAELEADIASLKKTSPKDLSPDYIRVGRFGPNGAFESNQVHAENLRNNVKQRENKRYLGSVFFKYFLIRLDGRTRFQLTDDRLKGDLLKPAENMLMHLFTDDAARKKVRDLLFDALGLYFTIEHLTASELRIRLSRKEPDEYEQSWNDAARKFHAEALHIKDASDGIQAFVGIVCAVLSGDYRAILVDEPEAFLHPPLARKLGYQLTNNLKQGGVLMASTHSPDFLMGCLQASAQVRVVRLEYANGKSKGTIVDSDALVKFFKTPLIRSANVVSALFHDGVVVTESDNDRVFYSEIYYRLSEAEQGLPSILFVNAQNKQTIQNIVGPLRSFGVPSVAIPDIDILKDGGATWTGWMNAAQIPEASQLGLGQQRSVLKEKFKNLDMGKGGVELLEKNDKASATDFFDLLQSYGIFAVRQGELESWLQGLKVTSRETQWTVDILEKMGDDPGKKGYLRPGKDDVWEFMRGVARWVRDPNRKGTN